MLTRDFQQLLTRPSGSEATSNAKAIVDKYHNERESWLDFCIFPDLLDPVRMPSLFPVPSHLCKRQTVFTVDANATGNIYGLFKPLTVDPGDLDAGYRSAFSYIFTDPVLGQNSDDPLAGGVVEQAGANTRYTPSLTGVTGLIHGGARLIASVIEVEYMGTLEQHSGLIEVGLHMHSVNSLTDMKIVHLFDQAEIVQAPLYKKFKPMDGARCVWFPVDDNDFQFQDYDIGGAGTGEGTTTSLNLTLRQPVFPQWAINLSGIQNNQRLRFSICSYFETLPDENYRDIFMATRSKQNPPLANVKSAVSAAVQTGAVSTPAKSSGMWGGYLSGIGSILAQAKEAYGLVQDYAPMFTGILSGNPLGAIGGAATTLAKQFG